MRIFVSFLFLIPMLVFSQQDAQYTQYMYNTININPAYAGTRNSLSVFALHRNQWVGFNGAPKTNAASINSYINNSDFGIGLSFLNDNIGANQENNVSVDLAYKIPLTIKYTLSFGFKTSVNFYSLDVNKLNIFQANDSEFQSLNGKITPNFGTGVYLYSNKLYAGFSVPNLLETKYFNDNSVAINQRKPSYNFISGYVFEVNELIKFKPSLLSKITQGTPIQLDINANFMYNEKLHFGASYRFNAALSGLIGFQFNDSWFLGYAYDSEITQFRNYNQGSHEIFLRYEVFNEKRITSPRFF
jgi:type IX secretion system PorP/SprF family membrane protein